MVPDVMLGWVGLVKTFFKKYKGYFSGNFQTEMAKFSKSALKKSPKRDFLGPTKSHNGVIAENFIKIYLY